MGHVKHALWYAVLQCTPQLMDITARFYGIRPDRINLSQKTPLSLAIGGTGKRSRLFLWPDLQPCTSGSARRRDKLLTHSSMNRDISLAN